MNYPIAFAAVVLTAAVAGCVSTRAAGSLDSMPQKLRDVRRLAPVADGDARRPTEALKMGVEEPLHCFFAKSLIET